MEVKLTLPEIYGDKNKFLDAEKAYKKNDGDLVQLNKEYEVVFEKVMELEEKMK